MTADPLARDLAVGPARHHPVTTWLHAAMALGLICQLALGWWMLDLPKTPPGLRAQWFNLHKSIGLTLGLLWLARLAWLWWRPAAPVHAIAAWQRAAAQRNHALLYLCMGLLPLTGLLGSGFSPYPVRWFSVELPRWSAPWPEAKAACSLAHEWLAWLMLAGVATHLAGVVCHVLRQERSVLASMLPSWQERARERRGP